MYSVWACTTCGHLRSSLRDPVARNCPHQQLPQMCWKQKFLSHQNGKGACSSKQCKKNGITVYVELICFCMPKLRVAINSAVVGDVQKCTKTLQLEQWQSACGWCTILCACLPNKGVGTLVSIASVVICQSYTMQNTCVCGLHSRIIGKHPKLVTTTVVCCYQLKDASIVSEILALHRWSAIPP